MTKYYLLLNPVYRNQLNNVWLQKEIPFAVVKKLNLHSHVNSWADFKNKMLAISKKEKGNAFEELINQKYKILSTEICVWSPDSNSITENSIRNFRRKNDLNFLSKIDFR